LCTFQPSHPTSHRKSLLCFVFRSKFVHRDYHRKEKKNHRHTHFVVSGFGLSKKGEHISARILRFCLTHVPPILPSPATHPRASVLTHHCQCLFVCFRFFVYKTRRGFVYGLREIFFFWAGFQVHTHLRVLLSVQQPSFVELTAPFFEFLFVWNRCSQFLFVFGFVPSPPLHTHSILFLPSTRRCQKVSQSIRRELCYVSLRPSYNDPSVPLPRSSKPHPSCFFLGLKFFFLGSLEANPSQNRFFFQGVLEIAA